MMNRLVSLIVCSIVLMSALTPRILLAQGMVQWYVSTAGNDQNDCLAPSSPCATINGAVAKAGIGDVVRVTSGDYKAAGSEVVLLDRDLFVSGGWNQAFTEQVGLTVVDGELARTAMRVTSDARFRAIVDRFTFRNGVSIGLAGGGIRNEGRLELRNCTVADNANGGIWNGNELRVLACTIHGNTSDSGAAGIQNELGAWLALVNSTVSGNHSTSEGGGLNVGSLVRAILKSSTIANNVADVGGGIANLSDGTLELENTIVAGNSARFGPDCVLGGLGSEISLGHNILGSGCSFMSGSGDFFGVDPLLGALQDNDGPTPTHALSPGSPAIDAGSAGGCFDEFGNLLQTDQRGLPRDEGFGCDIGAFEMAAPVCDLQLNFIDQALWMGFDVGHKEASRWSVSLTAFHKTLSLWSVPIPPVHPPVFFSVPVHEFPALGTVGILTTLTTPSGGIVCSDWETIHTGTPGGVADMEALKSALRRVKHPLKPVNR